MPTQIHIHIARIAKPTTVYTEGLVADDGRCLKTFTLLPAPVSHHLTQSWVISPHAPLPACAPKQVAACSPRLTSPDR